MALPRFILLFALYLGLAGRFAWPELLAASLCALIALAFTKFVHSKASRRFTLHPKWVMLLGRITRHILRDCRIVAGALLRALIYRRQIEGAFRELRWPHHTNAEEAASLRALVTIGTSLAPNSFVVEVQEDEHRLIMHHLVPPARDGEEIWLP